MENSPLLSVPVRLALALLLVASIAASLYVAYPAVQARRENARLKAELLHLRSKTERLRGKMDTLQYDKRPAPVYSL